MKKILILLITSFLLCTGCADFLNDGNTMTLQDCPGALEPKIEGFSMYLLNQKDATSGRLYWTNTTTYPNNLYIYSLNKKNGVYKEKDAFSVGNSSSTIHHLSNPFSESELADGYIIVHRIYRTDSEYWEYDLSRIVKKDEIAIIKAGDPSTWPADSVLTNTGSVWDEQTQTPQPSQTETNNRLWINLNNKAWICLGRTE